MARFNQFSRHETEFTNLLSPFSVSGVLSNSEIRRIRRLAARHDRERLGLAIGHQSRVEQSFNQSQGNLFCREWHVFCHRRQSARQVLVS